MQTLLAAEFHGTAQGTEAADILRSCVRCGFCTATCPTYQLLGDELDGPRGRIQLIKQVLEGHEPTRHTQRHLDRCLTCRACETTCPSGVRYGALLDIGRQVVDARVPRPWLQRAQRALLRGLLTSRAFGPLHRLGHRLRWLAPRALRPYLQVRRDALGRTAAAVPGTAPAPSEARRSRRVLLLAGCVQPAMAPGVAAATRRVLARLGIEAVSVPGAGCCGSVRQHLGDPDGALAEARRNIDAWWPQLVQGAEAVLSENSGCGLMLADYGRLLAHDARYCERAARLAALGTDLAAFIERELASMQRLLRPMATPAIAFQAPCTLQHGLKASGAVERILTAAGARLLPVAEAQLCCGSAGTYSLLQPAIAETLRTRKLAALTAAGPGQILSANIGCITHLAAAAAVPVRHWVEWLDERMAAAT
jgi:glycolate oxidase iron-sulfur subunit